MASLRLAVDAMSGDLGLRSSIPASLAALCENPQLHITLVGDSASITAALGDTSYDSSRLKIAHSQSVVTMEDKPVTAVRRKRDSSMAVALELLNSGQVAGMVSAGNTGALVAMGCLIVERLPGIRRPAICAPIPSRQGHTFLLDLGANVDSDAADLHQFALMGAALAGILDAKVNPRVAILNIGGEPFKGKAYLTEAARCIDSDSRLSFVGYVEGGDLFGDLADVVVCEGFVGNVALKVCEGTASFIADTLKEQFGGSLYRRLVGLMAMPILRTFGKNIDPQHYNGAALLGLKGVVVKSHGGSESSSFHSAIRQASQAVSMDLPALIAARMASAGNNNDCGNNDE